MAMSQAEKTLCPAQRTGAQLGALQGPVQLLAQSEEEHEKPEFREG